MVKLTYHGHSAWEVAGKEHRVIIDPFLTGNALADVGADSFEKLDAILITQNNEIAIYYQNQSLNAHPLHIGGGRQFPFGHVKLTIAHHGSTGPKGEALGNPAGIVLTIDGRKIYHAGDTGLFLDMKLIGEMYGPLDAALLPIGDNFTMGIDDAVKAVEFLEAKVNIPMHYKTFPPIDVDPNEFISKVEATGAKAVLVNPGESYTIE
jgi:L-ascorbate metabolism protein UlaG (beta-lactamase superfamily)